MNRDDGQLVARTRIDKERVLVPTKNAGELLLGFSSSGALTAYRTRAREVSLSEDEQ